MPSPTISLRSICFRNNVTPFNASKLWVGKVVTYGVDKLQVAGIVINAWEVKANEYRTDFVNVTVSFEAGPPIIFWLPSADIEGAVGA